jgi:hypothetical protein
MLLVIGSLADCRLTKVKSVEEIVWKELVDDFICLFATVWTKHASSPAQRVIDQPSCI